MTTLGNIITALRAQNIVATSKVNFGISDKLEPPYINVTSYEHVDEYDTSGVTLRTATFTVLVVDKSCDDAEAVATTVDTFVNNNLTLTTTTIGCMQQHYKVGQLDEKKYQFGVELTYELIERN